MGAHTEGATRRELYAREAQLKQLSLLVIDGPSSPGLVIVHGPEGTGKTSAVKYLFEESAIDHHSIVQCRECVTARHLFETIIGDIYAKLSFGQSNGHAGGVPAAVQKCESISAFSTTLHTLVSRHDKFIVVLDGIDELREATPTLIPTLARLGEVIPSLTIIMIVRYPPARSLRTPGVPHIYFPPYTREQACAILSIDPPSLYPPDAKLPEDYDEEIALEDAVWLYSRFTQAVWDSLAKGAANDLVSFRALAERLWRPFVQPIVDGTFRARDFSRLVTAQRRLLQDESCLQDSLLVNDDPSSVGKPVTHEFPYFTKWLMCAAYLASFNPSRLDALHFMKATERKKKKKGGGTAAGKQSKTRKIPRHLLSPAAFPIDRLLAILHAIIPHDIVTNIDIYSQIATLGSLRLFVRSGQYSSDSIDRTGKWRVNYGHDYVLRLARSLNFDITDYLAE